LPQQFKRAVQLIPGGRCEAKCIHPNLGRSNAIHGDICGQHRHFSNKQTNPLLAQFCRLHGEVSAHMIRRELVLLNTLDLGATILEGFLQRSNVDRYFLNISRKSADGLRESNNYSAKIHASPALGYA
jgi:hypothetical protein